MFPTYHEVYVMGNQELNYYKIGTSMGYQTVCADFQLPLRSKCCLTRFALIATNA